MKGDPVFAETALAPFVPKSCPENPPAKRLIAHVARWSELGAVQLGTSETPGTTILYHLAERVLSSLYGLDLRQAHGHRLRAYKLSFVSTELAKKWDS